MNTYRAAHEVPLSGRAACLAIGFFDGVHRGHQEIIGRTIASARRQSALSLVVTFEPHPASIVAPERAPKLIYPLSHRTEVIASCGADALLLLHFDRQFSEQTAEEFIRSLARGLRSIQSVCVGANFHFGRGRGGDSALLASLGQELGFTVDAVQVVNTDGATISSTRIREAVRQGDFARASVMLGRPYALVGPVVRGDGLGRKLGFATANIDTNGLVLPPNGVYAVTVKLRGRVAQAVLNIGLRPTVKSGVSALRVEVHIPGVTEDLYGETLSIEPLSKLRDEQKFPSLQALQQQIAEDVRRALSIIPGSH